MSSSYSLDFIALANRHPPKPASALALQLHATELLSMDIHSALTTESLKSDFVWRGRAGRIASTARTALAAAMHEHRIVLCLALGYMASGGLLLNALGRSWPIEVTNRSFGFVWMSMSVVWLGWCCLRSPKQLRETLPASRFVGAIIVTALVVPTQITFQALKQAIGPVIGFHGDPLLHRIDVFLHGGMAWTWFEPLLNHPSWIRVIDRLYTSWFAFLFLFVFWAAWSGARVLRQRALVAFLLMWIGAGTATAWLASSAGPCYYEHVVAESSPYQPLLARLDAIGSAHGELNARFNQQWLWKLTRANKWGQFAGISAMPSLHVGVAVLMALVSLQRSRLLGFVLVLYAGVIQIGSVILAWHYAVDGYLGALLAILCWTVAGTLVKGSARPRSAFRMVENRCAITNVGTAWPPST